jgi:hypothetical protein
VFIFHNILLIETTKVLRPLFICDLSHISNMIRNFNYEYDGT